MQIKKTWCAKENLRTPSYAYLRTCIFSKEITAWHLPKAKSQIFIFNNVSTTSSVGFKHVAHSIRKTQGTSLIPILVHDF
jgi:hypothetical protein